MLDKRKENQESLSHCTKYQSRKKCPMSCLTTGSGVDLNDVAATLHYGRILPMSNHSRHVITSDIALSNMRMLQGVIVEADETINHKAED